MAHRVDQLDIDADPLSLAPDTAFQDGRYIQRLADFANIVRLSAIGQDRGPRDHLQIADLGEVGQDVILNPIGEIGIRGVGAEIREGQNRDRFFQLPGSGAGKDEIPHQRRNDQTSDGQRNNVSAPAGEGGWTNILRSRLRCDLDPIRTDVEGPRQDERDWEPGQNKDDDEPRRPKDGEDRRGNLNYEPACHAIARRHAIDLASPQFAKKSIET